MNDNSINWLNPLALIAITSFVMIPFGQIYELSTLAFSTYYFIHIGKKGLKNYRFSQQEKLFSIVFLTIYLPILFSLIDAIDPLRTLKTTAGLLRHYFLGMGIIVAISTYKPSTILISKILSVVLVFWVLNGFIQALFGVDLFNQPPPFPDRISGIFGQDAKLGYMLVPLMGLALAWTYTRDTKFLFYILLTTLVSGVFISGDRGGWLGLFWVLILGLVSLSIHEKRYLPLTLIPAIPLIAFIVFAVSPEHSALKERGNESLSSISALLNPAGEKQLSPSDQHRMQIFSGAAELFISNPLTGIGARGFHTAYNELLKEKNLSYPYATHAHQILLEVSSSTGIIGIIGLITFYGLLFQQLKISIQQNNYFAMGGFISVIAFLFPIGSHFSIYASSTAIIIWSVIAISIANNRQISHRIDG